MPDADAIRDLWEVDLKQEALPGALDAAGVGRLAQLLRGASIPIVDAPAETVWIWSDLHLGDQALLAVGQRPSSTTLEMDDYLLEAWRRRVGLQDLIICLGDVVHPEAEPSTVAGLRNCPGRRLLVLGNHDVGDRERLRDVGFVDQQVAVLCATDPPLAGERREERPARRSRDCPDRQPRNGYQLRCRTAAQRAADRPGGPRDARPDRRLHEPDADSAVPGLPAPCHL